MTSRLVVNSIRHTGSSSDAVTLASDGSCAVNNTQRQGRNLVVNGSMLCSQRGSSFSQVANNEITVDRFGLVHPYSTHMNVSHSTDAPDGFSKSFKLGVDNTDSSIGSGQYVVIRHRIEAQNLQQLGFGTSGAKSISLSFYVKSNKTGTFSVNIQQTDNSDKQVSAPFTINSANTWERKTFTFAGDTSGVINDDNGTGLSILWWLSAGSNYNSGTSRSTFTAYADADVGVGCNVNILDSTSNNFYLTGVQLEASDAVSDFEHISFHDELYRCYRYFQRWATGDGKPIANGFYYNSTQIKLTCNLFTTMRTTPTLSHITGTHYYVIYRDGAADTFDSFVLEPASDANRCGIYAYQNVSGTAGQTGIVRCNNAAPNGGQIDFNAEL